MPNKKNNIPPSTFNQWLKQNFTYIGYTKRKPNDKEVYYYQQPNGYIVATSNLNELNGFSYEDGGAKKLNQKIIDIHQKDITAYVLEDAKKFAEISEGLKSLLTFPPST